MTDKVQLPRLYLAWLTPPLLAPGDAALDAAASVLAGGKNSRLYKRLVYDLQIAQDVSAIQGSQALGSVVPDRGRRPRPGHTLDEVQKVVDEETRQAARVPAVGARAGARRSTRSRRRSTRGWSGSAASAARPIS